MLEKNRLEKERQKDQDAPSLQMVGEGLASLRVWHLCDTLKECSLWTLRRNPSSINAQGLMGIEEAAVASKEGEGLDQAGCINHPEVLL